MGHAEVLLDRDSLSYMTPTVRSLMTLTPVMDALVEAFRSGGGVSWDAYGTDAREAVGDSNRPIYLQVLPRDWLPKIPEIHDRLRAAPPARVADIGCGTGWSSIAIAGAYPGVRVDGFDRDEESLAFARRNAETSGVADRVSFEARDAGEPGDAGAYDVVTFFECLHDMSRPVDALRVARGLLTGDGVVFVADEPTNDEFIGAEDDLDRYHYGWSLFACLPTAMVDPGSAGTGTVMRPSTLRSYARSMLDSPASTSYRSKTIRSGCTCSGPNGPAGHAASLSLSPILPSWNGAVVRPRRSSDVVRPGVAPPSMECPSKGTRESAGAPMCGAPLAAHNRTGHRSRGLCMRQWELIGITDQVP